MESYKLIGNTVTATENTIIKKNKTLSEHANNI